MKAIYVCDNLGEDNTTEVWFEDPNKDVLVEISGYIIKYVTEASMRNVPFNAWADKVIKGHTRDIRLLYRVKGIGRGYRLEMDGRYRKQELESKKYIPRALKSKMTRNNHNKGKKDW